MPCLILQNCLTEALLPVPLQPHRFPLSEATHSFPAHPYGGAVQDRQFIYQFLCFQLLKNTDQDIQNNDRDEEHIGICPDSEQERRDQKVKKIEQCKKIISDDLRFCLGDLICDSIFLAAFSSFLHLLFCQSG